MSDKESLIRRIQPFPSRTEIRSKPDWWDYRKNIVREIESAGGPDYVLPMPYPASVMRLQKYDADTSSNKSITDPKYDIFTIRPLLDYAKAQMDYISGKTDDTKAIEEMTWNYLLDEYMRPTFIRHFIDNDYEGRYIDEENYKNFLKSYQGYGNPVEEYARLIQEPLYDDGPLLTIYDKIDALNRARELYNMLPDSLPYTSNTYIKPYNQPLAGNMFVDETKALTPMDWKHYQPPPLPSSFFMIELQTKKKKKQKSDDLIDELNKHFNSLDKSGGLMLEVE